MIYYTNPESFPITEEVPLDDYSRFSPKLDTSQPRFGHEDSEVRQSDL